MRPDASNDKQLHQGPDMVGPLFLGGCLVLCALMIGAGIWSVNRTKEESRRRLAAKVVLTAEEPLYIDPTIAARLDADEVASLISQVKASRRPIRLAVLGPFNAWKSYQMNFLDVPKVIGATAVVVMDIPEGAHSSGYGPPPVALGAAGGILLSGTGERFALFPGKLADLVRPFEVDDEATLAAGEHARAGPVRVLSDLVGRLEENRR